MDDAARPSDEKFTKVLQESLETWISYLSARSDDKSLPHHSIGMKPLVSHHHFSVMVLILVTRKFHLLARRKSRHAGRIVFLLMAGQRGRLLRGLVTYSQGSCLSNFY